MTTRNSMFEYLGVGGTWESCNCGGLLAMRHKIIMWAHALRR